ncbi:1-deoxy-D-xylulose-5-phosphate reductoisomerase [Rhodohalobacter barkolensis]|uniref:1-deoxy-D-xylulose 5-phosphate reductoisomerase n=1 Tax=Rhodohalobacter barkolensis TaxID=2053187 RepID=A0A2N0VK22_9BACT|nr:1-deoxy-D-xylulose-5-phosphate reductoisomerase [Rhodohalobacter barkolensis]PKD44530.1 1-deoxy-D-xylulose-5-phosphate reductoisomerase [Rhodohalobacter barkolensis]
MKQKKLAILGSTGSIGTQAIDIISAKPNLFHVSVLTANRSYEKLAQQVNRFKPDTVVLCDKKHRIAFLELLKFKPKNILFGQESLEQVTKEAEYDVLLNSLVGFAGFMSTYTALKRGKKVALANKESLVVGGELLSQLEGFKQGNLIPVDSEHSAMLQSMIGENKDSIQKIIITASGGPFRDFSMDALKDVTVQDALNHPNWDMGSKITIDSATMMNKGLEIIEAKWFFGLGIEQIVPVIHPQSIIHSIVEFKDGSSKAQMGPPDMKVPILYAFTYPDRIDFPNKTLDYSELINMELKPVDYNRFPCLELAIEASKKEGGAPAVLNAANEIAVERFLNGEIRYIDIPKIIEESLNHIQFGKEITPETLLYIDKETREYANALLQ